MMELPFASPPPPTAPSAPEIQIKEGSIVVAATTMWDGHSNLDGFGHESTDSAFCDFRYTAKIEGWIL